MAELLKRVIGGFKLFFQLLPFLRELVKLLNGLIIVRVGIQIKRQLDEGKIDGLQLLKLLVILRAFVS